MGVGVRGHRDRRHTVKHGYVYAGAGEMKCKIGIVLAQALLTHFVLFSAACCMNLTRHRRMLRDNVHESHMDGNRELAPTPYDTYDMCILHWI